MPPIWRMKEGPDTDRCSYARWVSSPVLETKLFAPTRRAKLVARPRLTRQLDITLEAGHRLTLVAAPAGFGKTTVLTDWIADLAGRRPPPRVAWLSLDGDDDDLTRLLTHLVAALGRVGIDIAPTVLEAMPGSSTPAVLTVLVNELRRAGASAAGQQWVLVLDDYHSISSADVHEALVFLLDHLPDQLHLVVASRTDPPLPLARLRSRGQLSEIRAADLRFTAEEAHDFLSSTMGLTLTGSDVEALEERTEGWIAGLQLAALSLRGLPDRGEIAGFIKQFAGSNRFVIDYLADEVLARQPDNVRDFLLATAVLDRLTGSLCDALTGRADGARMLEHLDRANLFLVPLDTERSWYRYHHLFADVLQARLLAEAPDQIRALHGRASVWFASQDLVPDAVRHALAARDFERAGLLVEEGLPELRRTRQDALMLSWVRSLPDSVVHRSPVLSILSGWSLLVAGDLDGLESRLDDADAALAVAAADGHLAAAWADTEDLRTAPATISVYRASLAQARGDVAGTRRHAQHALGLAGPDDHFVRGASGGFLGLAAWAAGDVEEALATFSEAVRSLHAAGNLVDELDSTVVLADLCVVSGHPSRARILCEQALGTAATGGIPHARATADLHVALAELDRELDDLVSAEAHLETARVLGERAYITENRHRWFVAMAQVRSASGDYAAATRLLDQGAEVYLRGFYPDVRPIAAMRARVQIAAGDLASADAWADASRLRASDDADFLREYEHLTLARLLLAHGDASAATSVVALLGRLHGAALEAGRRGSATEIEVLQALAHRTLGDLPQALAALSRALVEAPEPEHNVRVFLDEGAPMEALLHAVALQEMTQAPARRLLERARRHDTVSDVSRAGSPTSPGQALDPLSRRELEVLRLLDSELTGPEIARQLYVTVNTLRTHTKHIFTKLDAQTRTAAVRRARERGLL